MKGPEDETEPGGYGGSQIPCDQCAGKEELQRIEKFVSNKMLVADWQHHLHICIKYIRITGHDGFRATDNP